MIIRMKKPSPRRGFSYARISSLFPEGHVIAHFEQGYYLVIRHGAAKQYGEPVFLIHMPRWQEARRPQQGAQKYGLALDVHYLRHAFAGEPERALRDLHKHGEPFAAALMAQHAVIGIPLPKVFRPHPVCFVCVFDHAVCIHMMIIRGAGIPVNNNAAARLNCGPPLYIQLYSDRRARGFPLHAGVFTLRPAEWEIISSAVNAAFTRGESGEGGVSGFLRHCPLCFQV